MTANIIVGNIIVENFRLERTTGENNIYIVYGALRFPSVFIFPENLRIESNFQLQN